jgi:uncharacterized protein (DUF58 family)
MALLTYGDGDIHYLPPGKGKRHAQQLVRCAMTPAESCQQTATLAGVLDHLQRVVHGRALVCIFSDFIDPLPSRSLAAITARHDTVAVVVSDPLELELPNAGLLRLVDIESGQVRLIDSGSTPVRYSYRRLASQRQIERREALAATGAALLELGTRIPPLHPLMQFFRGRQQRRGR